MTQREAGLQEVLTAHSDYSLSNVYTYIPGIIVSVTNLGQQRVVVQPVINMVSQDKLSVAERPPILDVPLEMPLTKLGGLNLPIEPGNPVMLKFSMRGLDVWKASNGYPSTPSDIRKFDIRDCTAIPGAYPWSESPNQPSRRSLNHDPSDVVLVHNIGSGNEVEIRLKRNGDVKITSPGKVEVECKEAEVNASDSMKVETQDFKVTSTNYQVETVNYTISATGTAVQTGTMNHNGPWILNGIEMGTHVHVENESITDGPQNA